MVVITIGNDATNRDSSNPSGNTYIDKNNAATDTGTITQVNLYVATEMTGVKIGTFSGAGLSWTNRDVAVLGTLSAGLNQVPVNIDVVTGDFIGLYFTGGALDRDVSGGSGYNSKSGDQFGAGAQTYTNVASRIMSAGGTGPDPSPATGGDNMTIIGENIY